MVVKIVRAIVMSATIAVGRGIRGALSELYYGVKLGGKTKRVKTDEEKQKEENEAPNVRTRIDREEALEVLELEEDFDEEQLKEKYDKLMDANSEKKGASFYLQSKVFRANERLLEDLEAARKAAGEAVGEEGAEGDSKEDEEPLYAEAEEINPEEGENDGAKKKDQGSSTS
mmetsp:Transcript_12833/g.23323  ORF Transcript_12833/g.23323 Transcript_12833/m.23323 type:complete len:172 (+) Transcript_12833:108-623(+)|eukprot:CAMPEP_0197528128 /NCGR_PEP_ID=MMETSP1318-20131121/23964_1 /TAXON_ID=552666 /ORGANISM="Partenskyella glossopodia, Strain RCC365" /LENGTH=171 /DNA_ID=CAMNT_0043083087 /DNA_START=86 /DNA_END=601 /DNA_ORIENTATION=+